MQLLNSIRVVLVYSNWSCTQHPLHSDSGQGSCFNRRCGIVFSQQHGNKVDEDHKGHVTTGDAGVVCSQQHGNKIDSDEEQ